MRVLGGVTNHTFYKYFLSRKHLLCYSFTSVFTKAQTKRGWGRKELHVFPRSNNFFRSLRVLTVMVTSLKLEMTSGEWTVGPQCPCVIAVLELRAFLN